ncbi:MAG: Gfo/Idh/MocA family oxidoreductase [Pseudomonadota bacterium]
MAQPLKALIIGAGSIGGLIDSPKSTNIASHAHAYTQCPDTKITAICEPSELNVFAFMERWGEVKRYFSIEELGSESYDIASITSITAAHFNHLSILIQRSDCPMILCEKPVVATKEELSTLYMLIKNSPKKIIINLMRRYNPAFIALANRIQKGDFGENLGFQGVCTKGLLHNGSHLLAVLSHFLGNLNSIKPFSASHCQGDVCGEFGISLENGEGAISVLKSPDYSLFEITLWFETAVIKVLEGGEKIDIYSKIPSPLYKGYFTLELHDTITTNLSRYALDSLEFLIHKSDEECRHILHEHLQIHERIFQTMEKVY